jgi:hypothetical protein
MRSPLFALLVCGFLCAASAAREVEETYPEGKIKLRYNVDADGRKDGASTEYHENGKVKIRAEYRAGQLEGPYASFHDNGQPHVSAIYKQGKLDGEYTNRNAAGQLQTTASYKQGKLHGWRTGYLQGEVTAAQAYRDGEVVAARGPQQIRRQLAEIEREPEATSKLDALTRDREAALRRLKAYRFLSGLPYEDMELDAEQNDYATAASNICHKLGKMDHAPANPGLPEDEYKIARMAAGSSNLYMDLTDFVKCVDGWMDDSDASNLSRLGHRRWCLNPWMKKCGFGRTGKFAAMYVFDDSRKEVPDYEFVGYPAPGVMPTSYFGPRIAWSISLNPKKFKKPGDDVKVTVMPLDKRFEPAGKPLEFADSHINNSGFGIANCIIFLPKKVDVSPGARYWVEVENLKSIDGKPATVRYFVEFSSLK